MLTRLVLALVLIFGAAAQAIAEETKVVALGLTDHAATEAELGKAEALPRPKFNTPGVAYALVANLKKGDSIEVSLNKDGKPLMHNVQELSEDQATALVQAGKTGVPAGGWPDGAYTATVTVSRGGKPLITQQSEPMPFD
jgi:hypothetical protein